MPLSIVYVVTNPGMPGLVKIGKTSQDDAQYRLGQLYTTGVPFPFKVEFACRVTNPDDVELALHTAFAPHRVNPKREFFAIEPGQAIAILKLLHVGEDATAAVSVQPAQIGDQEVAAGENYRSRRPNLNFEEMGIPVGAELVSSAAEGRSVIVTGPRKVRLGDEEMSLTAATKKVLSIDYAVAPGPYWTYDGRLLQDIYEETYPVEIS